MTINEAIESMRNAVNEPAAAQCQQMRVLADVWRENGKELHGEALELLGECGKCGAANYGYGDTHIADESISRVASVANSWIHRAMRPFDLDDEDRFYGVIPNRLALMDTYAAADQETRERWAAETRELSEGVT